jgi:hypothetical protein
MRLSNDEIYKTRRRNFMNNEESERPIAITNNTVIHETGDETLVYNLLTNRCFNLNRISSLVWQHCDGKKKIEQIAAEISKQLRQPVPVELVWLAVRELRKENLVLVRLETPSNLRGLNRRQIIKQVGLSAGLVTIPMVISIAAPKAANAQSGAPAPVDPCAAEGIGMDVNKTPNGGSCNGNGNCCSNNCCPLGGGPGVCIPAGATC